jgi:hypothetical protein
LGPLAVKAVSAVEDDHNQAVGCLGGLPAGYRSIALTFQVENVSSELVDLWQNPLSVTAKSDTGYVYGCGGSDQPGDRWPQEGVIPPGFGLPINMAVDVPTGTQGLTITIAAKSGESICPGGDACTQDFPLSAFSPTAVAGNLDVPSSGLKKLGESFSQGPLTVTATSVSMIKPCTPVPGDYGWGSGQTWTLAIDMKVTNSYGYSLWNAGTQVQVLDQDGRIWTRGDMGLDSVPPGSSASAKGTIGVSDFDSDHPCNGPAASSGSMYLVLVMPQLLGQNQDVLAGATWGIYELGIPPKQ